MEVRGSSICVGVAGVGVRVGLAVLVSVADAVGDPVAVFEGFGEGDSVMVGWGEAVMLAGGVYVAFGVAPPQPANRIAKTKTIILSTIFLITILPTQLPGCLPEGLNGPRFKEKTLPLSYIEYKSE